MSKNIIISVFFACMKLDNTEIA